MKCIYYNDLKKLHQITTENTRHLEGACSCECYAPRRYDSQTPHVECFRIKNIYGDNEFNNILNRETSAANSK